jgi:hypothetical protein
MVGKHFSRGLTIKPLSQRKHKTLHFYITKPQRPLLAKQATTVRISIDPGNSLFGLGLRFITQIYGSGKHVPHCREA